MKLSELQAVYRNSLIESAPDSGAIDSADLTRLALDDIGDPERDDLLAPVLNDVQAAAGLRAALAVQPLAAELGREMAQADWAVQHTKKARPMARPQWLPFALAASVSLFAVGAWQISQRAVPQRAAESTTPATASAAAPSAGAAQGELFVGSFEADSAVASNPAAAPARSGDGVFHDDFGS